MNYKRLNNMTGMDKILNKRIASIFVNELASFRNNLTALPKEKDAESLKFNIHKIRPSMIIFELDSLLEKFELLASRKKRGDSIDEHDMEFNDTIKETDRKMEEIQEFIQSI